MSQAVRRVEQVDAQATVLEFLGSTKPKLMRLEGCMGVGKTTLAGALAPAMGGVVLSSDEYAVASEDDLAYPDCLRLAEMWAEARRLLDSSNPLLFDGVCSQQILPINRFPRGIVVYVKRLSFNNPEMPYWHDGDSFEEPYFDALRRSIGEYHVRFRPHENADLILELPDFGHALYGALPDQ